MNRKISDDKWCVVKTCVPYTRTVDDIFSFVFQGPRRRSQLHRSLQLSSPSDTATLKLNELQASQQYCHHAITCLICFAVANFRNCVVLNAKCHAYHTGVMCFLHRLLFLASWATSSLYLEVAFSETPCAPKGWSQRSCMAYRAVEKTWPWNILKLLFWLWCVLSSLPRYVISIAAFTGPQTKTRSLPQCCKNIPRRNQFESAEAKCRRGSRQGPILGMFLVWLKDRLLSALH